MRAPPLLVLLLSLSGFATAEQTPLNALLDYHATYEATFNGLPIEARRELTREAQGYKITTLAKNLLGNIREIERFHLDNQDRIRIDDYTSTRTIFGAKRSENLRIDPLLSKATYTRKKKQSEIDLAPEYLGPVSYQLQMRRDLAANASANTGTKATLSYQVISHGKIKYYQFEELGEETIVTALGDIKTLKVGRIREEEDRQTILWLAPRWAFLPVKIWQKESDGETYEMTLKALTFDSIDQKALATSPVEP